MGMSEQLAEIQKNQEQQQQDIKRLIQSIQNLQAAVKEVDKTITELGVDVILRKEDIENLIPSNKESLSAEQIRAIVAQEVAKVKDIVPKSQPPIAEKDRELLNSNLLSLQRITGDHSLIYKVVFGCTIALVLFSLWTQYKMKTVVEEVNTNYDRTTAILSRDSNYWFDGENFNIAQKSPTADRLRKVLEDYQRQKQEQNSK